MAQTTTINTTTRIINNGIIDAPVVKAIVANLFGALRPEWADLPQALGRITFLEYKTVIEGGTLAEGRDVELASITPRLLKSAYRRLAYALGAKDNQLAQSDAFHQPESGVSSGIASGMAELFDAMPVYDPEADGLGFEITSYRPTVIEATYDIECILRLMFSLSKHEGLSWLARPFEGSDGNLVNVAPTYREWALAERRRHAEILSAMALAEKNGEVYLGQQPLNETLLAGLEVDAEAHPSKIGANEAFEGVEALLNRAGYNTDIGKEIVEGAGYGKACNLIESLSKRNWRGAKAALRHVALISQSSLGVALVKQITESPEWEAASYEREDAELRKVEAKAKRESDRDARLAAIERDKQIRALHTQRDTLLATKAQAEFELESALIVAETAHMLGRATKAQKELLVKQGKIAK